MRKEILIFGLLVLAIVGGFLYPQGGESATAKAASSSIIELRTEAEIEQLHASVAAELDEMEALLGAADGPQSMTPSGAKRLEIESAVRAPAGNAAELAAYEAVRDERLQSYAMAQKSPPARLTAAPAIPAPGAIAGGEGSGRAAAFVGGFCFSVIQGSAIAGRRQSPDRQPERSTAAAGLIQLAYHALRNGYTGGGEVRFHEILSPAPSIAHPAPGSAPGVLSFYQSQFTKATAFVDQHSGVVRRSEFALTHIHIGDVA